jgi:hypothetical protein
MQVRAQFPDIFLATALPALDELVWQGFDYAAPDFSKVFRIMSSTRSIEQTSQLSGLGTFSSIAEGADVTFDKPVAGFSKTFTHTQYGNGFKMTARMLQDDKHAIVKKNATELGRGARETLELLTWGTLNNAFAGGPTGPDGVVLCSASHPQVKVGGVQSNLLTSAADFDVPSLELALTDFRNAKDSAGKFMRLPAKYVLGAPSNEFNFSEILSGKMRSDTANNTLNAFRNRDGYESFTDFMTTPYLTDPDAWFVMAPKERTQLRFYWREKPVTLHDMDFYSRSALTAMWMTFSYGFSDYLGVYGTPGA